MPKPTNTTTTTTTAAATAPKAAQWTKTVEANKQVWLYLFMDDEIVTSFTDSKDVTMKHMAWWNAATTEDVRRVDAQKVAIAIHRFFGHDMGLEHQGEFTTNSFNRAILALTTVLVNPDATVPELAARVNDIFVFEDEQ